MPFNVGDPVKHVYQDGIIGKVIHAHGDIVFHGGTLMEAAIFVDVVDGSKSISFRPQDLQLCRCANRGK